MAKKILLIVFAVLLAAALVAGAGPASAKKIILKTQSTFPLGAPLQGTDMVLLADWIKESSGGEIVLKLYDPGKLVAPSGALESVSKGRIQAVAGQAAMWAGQMSASPLFTSIPFGAEAPEYVAWLFFGNGLKLYQEMYDRAGYNVKVLPAVVIPPESSGWFTKEIKTVDDLKGLKMRFYGLGGNVMEKLGVAVTALPAGEIFPALEKGVIDATEFGSPSGDEFFGFYKVAKYNYFPGWHQTLTLGELLINKETWEKDLTEQQRKLIELNTMAMMTWSMAEGEATQAPVMQTNVEKRGVQEMYWGPEFLAAYHAGWEEVVAEQCAKDEFFKKVWDDLSAFRQGYDKWHRFGYLPRATGPAK